MSATSPHEGSICPSGFHPERGFLFIVDAAGGRVFLGARDGGAVFAELRPGMRVAYATYATFDGRSRAHRVQILGDLRP